jgi:hypothetical protein
MDLSILACPFRLVFRQRMCFIGSKSNIKKMAPPLLRPDPAGPDLLRLGSRRSPSSCRRSSRPRPAATSPSAMALPSCTAVAGRQDHRYTCTSRRCSLHAKTDTWNLPSTTTTRVRLHGFAKYLTGKTDARTNTPALWISASPSTTGA